MPIRFRCVYCNQLLGIARRKAGKIVACTNCSGQLIVPDPVDVPEAAGDSDRSDADAGTEGPARVFEQSDFDAVLESASPAPSAVARAPAPPRPKSMTAPPLLQPPTMPMHDLAGKFVVSRALVTLFAGLSVALIGLSFAAGLLVGMALK